MNYFIMDAIIAPIMILGVFGNVNVLIAVFRKEALHAKGAMLIFVLALSHLVCNISELKLLIFAVRHQTSTAKECLLYNAPYSISLMFQSALFMSIAMDLCFCVIFPIKHLMWDTTKYILLMCIVPTCFTLMIFSLNVVFVPNGSFPDCEVTMAVNQNVFEVTSISMVVINAFTLLITLGAVTMAVRNSRKITRHRGTSTDNPTVGPRKIFIPTFFLMLFYIFLWMMSNICFGGLFAYSRNEKDMIPYMPFLSITTLPNFCQAYFVTYVRCPRFRQAYKEQLNVISFGCLFPTAFETPNNSSVRSGERLLPVKKDSGERAYGVSV